MSRASFQLAFLNADIIATVWSYLWVTRGLSAESRCPRAWKGEVEVLNIESGLLCGHIFQTGEERIYFIHERRVRGPGVYTVSDWLVASLSNAALSKGL